MSRFTDMTKPHVIALLVLICRGSSVQHFLGVVLPPDRLHYLCAAEVGTARERLACS